jgi:hypothetical protein
MPVLMVLGLLVFFYCLGALHDERRDRSLLFWKSLPVSDFTTVMSKLLLAVVVAPLITMGIAIVLGLVVLVAACIMLLTHGTNCSARCWLARFLPDATAPDRPAAGVHAVGPADCGLAADGVEHGALQGVPVGRGHAGDYLAAVAVGRESAAIRLRCRLDRQPHHQPHPAGRGAGLWIQQGHHRHRTRRTQDGTAGCHFNASWSTWVAAACGSASPPAWR